MSKRRWIDRSGSTRRLTSLLLIGCGGIGVDATSRNGLSAVEVAQATERLEGELELLRKELRIPAISAAVVEGDELLWSRGFGCADLEKQVEARADTPFGLASVTKPFAAVLLMRLVEDGSLDLDAPVSEFGIDLGRPGEITVRHLLSHTSGGVPGRHYQYDGGRFSSLTAIIEQQYGVSFRSALRREILEPLGMSRTALNLGACGLELSLSTLGPEDPERDFLHVYREVATPYQYDPAYATYPVPQPSYANAAAGLISTVEDLARFSLALGRDELVRPETRERMFTPTRLESGDDGPYGLGWFTEFHGDVRLVWHYGYGAYSSLFLMLPDEELTFIVLANTQNLSRPFQLGLGDVSVLASPFARAFFKEFVLQPTFDEPLPRIDWTAEPERVVEQLEQVADPELREVFEEELWAYRKVYGGVGRHDVATRLLRIHEEVFPEFDRSSRDVFVVGPPGPRPPEARRIQLTEEQAARWRGRYVLRQSDAGVELPSEVELRVIEGRIGVFPVQGECREFLAQTPTRLVALFDPNLVMVAEDGAGPFAIVAAENGGVRVGTYERVD